MSARMARRVIVSSVVMMVAGLGMVWDGHTPVVLGETPSAQPAGDIVQVAAAAGKFKTLLAAAKAAGLVGALEGPGPLTVFAPTDDAFAKLPAGTVENLLKPENKEKLAAILKYHVVAGKVMSGEVTKLDSVKTLEGQDLKITTKDGHVYVDNAMVVTADVPATNGVIHIIDAVVLPKQ